MNDWMIIQTVVVAVLAKTPLVPAGTSEILAERGVWLRKETPEWLPLPPN
jgi:hypothetical protein